MAETLFLYGARKISGTVPSPPLIFMSGCPVGALLGEPPLAGDGESVISPPHLPAPPPQLHPPPSPPFCPSSTSPIHSSKYSASLSYLVNTASDSVLHLFVFVEFPSLPPRRIQRYESDLSCQWS